MSVEILFFFMLAFGILTTASLVVLFRNPIYSAISLISTFLCLAGLYALLHAPFLAVIQVMVYAGAIMVLFLFVIMLLNLSDKELGKGKFTATKIVSTLVVGVIFAGLIGAIGTLGTNTPDEKRITTAFPGLNRLADVPDKEDIMALGTAAPKEGATAKPLSAKERDDLRREISRWDRFGSIRETGLLMYGKWMFVFEITGVLLLAAIIGAVVMAKRRLN